VHTDAHPFFALGPRWAILRGPPYCRFLARMPAFAQSLPSVPETALAAAVTVLAGLAGGVLAREAVEQLERVLARD
jgi:hypothetical protein